MKDNIESYLAYMKKILSIQFSEEFVRKMKARVFVGYHRYGESRQYKKDNKYSIKDTIQKRLDKYWETGNQEHLIDTANFLMIEYMHPQHLNAHWEDINEEDINKRLGVVMATQNQLTSTEKDVEVLLRVEEENERGLK